MRATHSDPIGLNLPESAAEERAQAPEKRATLLQRLEAQEANCIELEAEHDRLQKLSAAAHQKARSAWSAMDRAKRERDKTRHQLIAALPTPDPEPEWHAAGPGQ